MARLTPPERLAESFGFFAIGERGAGMIGPAIFGFASAYVGRLTALVVVAIFIMAGWWVLRTVPDGARGR